MRCATASPRSWDSTVSTAAEAHGYLGARQHQRAHRASGMLAFWARAQNAPNQAHLDHFWMYSDAAHAWRSPPPHVRSEQVRRRGPCRTHWRDRARSPSPDMCYLPAATDAVSSSPGPMSVPMGVAVATSAAVTASTTAPTASSTTAERRSRPAAASSPSAGFTLSQL